jgi:hypothetical protein
VASFLGPNYHQDKRNGQQCAEDREVGNDGEVDVHSSTLANRMLKDRSGHSLFPKPSRKKQ